jgi:DNA-binding MarR family transcriptional regulator
LDSFTRQRITLTEVLDALSEYRAAEASMLRRARSASDRGASEALALRYLGEAHAADLGMRPTELAAKLGLSSATVTGLVDRLVDSGLVLRERDPLDRRAVILRVTRRGAGMYAGSLDAAQQPLADVISSLDQEELATVLTFINRMRQAMDGIARAS